MKKPKILCITPVIHIKDVYESLSKTGNVTYKPETTEGEVRLLAPSHDALFTNPNKSNVFLGENVLANAPRLRVICTASTGTVHIDKAYANSKGIAVLSLTEERSIINRISSTAEHAFALTMAALRNIPAAWKSVQEGIWDYEKFIGRQLNYLTFGVIGFGRLGSFYAGYARAFGSRVLVYDPYKDVCTHEYTQLQDLDFLLEQADVVALHVHVTEETLGLLNCKRFKHMKPDVLVVNTSRGEVVDEEDMVAFLKDNPQARYATDVLASEVLGKFDSPIYCYGMTSRQVLITPHIGGMTREAQEMAYGHAATLLQQFFEKESGKRTNGKEEMLHNR